MFRQAILLSTFYDGGNELKGDSKHYFSRKGTELRERTDMLSGQMDEKGEGEMSASGSGMEVFRHPSLAWDYLVHSPPMLDCTHMLPKDSWDLADTMEELMPGYPPMFVLTPKFLVMTSNWSMSTCGEMGVVMATNLGYECFLMNAFKLTHEPPLDVSSDLRLIDALCRVAAAMEQHIEGCDECWAGMEAYGDTASDGESQTERHLCAVCSEVLWASDGNNPPPSDDVLEKMVQEHSKTCTAAF